jgi:hypothetical protein
MGTGRPSAPAIRRSSISSVAAGASMAGSERAHHFQQVKDLITILFGKAIRIPLGGSGGAFSRADVAENVLPDLATCTAALDQLKAVPCVAVSN